jgi:hypothetical protein
MTAEFDDILDGLFHGCAFAAFVDQAIAQGGPPDREATRVRAYRYYEDALAIKNGGRASERDLGDDQDCLTRPRRRL